jgi:hypothetical protein
MEIHVNHQNAGVINYVEGTNVVYGGQHGSVVTDAEAWRAVGELRQALTRVPLAGRPAAQARAEVAELDAAVRAPQADKGRAAGALGRLTDLLTRTGSLAAAGSALVGPLQTLATWLGAHGAAILAMLAL